MTQHPVLGDTCFIHHREEPGPGFLRCGECGHLYVTEDDLVLEHELVSGETEPSNKIFICPQCGHDF